ncbi:MAG TPA: hypothetical protein VIJ63_22795 [Roseiarcus sp.]
MSFDPPLAGAGQFNRWTVDGGSGAVTTSVGLRTGVVRHRLALGSRATVSGGQSVTVAVAGVPERSTRAMAIGFAGLGFSGYGRVRRRPAPV